jgi:peptidoglycan/LPS O-acetylase OafA/YrhL
MVVALHVGYLVHPAVTGPARSYFPGGFAGVDVFFVLSGFLITSLLLQERDRRGGIGFKKFYIRRALRLLPALAALLAVHVIYAIQQGRSLSGEFEAVASIGFYASNITQSFHLYMPVELSHTWSLSVEEQFYLLWPAALAYLLYRRAKSGGDLHRTVPVLLVVALVVTNVARVIVWHTEGYPAAYMLPYCHADGLVVGAMLAFAYQRGRAPRRGASTAGWIGLIFLLAFTVLWVQGKDASSIYYGGYTVLAVASAAVINAVLVAPGRLSKALSWRPLVAVGRVSYGLYLWHVMLLNILLQHTLGLGVWPRAALGLALSAAATIGSWYLIEQPALHLKERFSSGVAALAPSSASGAV